MCECLHNQTYQKSCTSGLSKPKHAIRKETTFCGMTWQCLLSLHVALRGWRAFVLVADGIEIDLKTQMSCFACLSLLQHQKKTQEHECSAPSPLAETFPAATNVDRLLRDSWTTPEPCAGISCLILTSRNEVSLCDVLNSKSPNLSIKIVSLLNQVRSAVRTEHKVISKNPYVDCAKPVRLSKCVRAGTMRRSRLLYESRLCSWLFFCHLPGHFHYLKKLEDLLHV